jgi:dTDP-4-amino-4,6-dideoxygalactose transaminase
MQECFEYVGYKEGDLPESEKAARETLALPIYPELRPEQQEFVVRKIGEFFQ